MKIELLDNLPNVMRAVPTRQFSNLHVGGTAEAQCTVNTLDELIEALMIIKEAGAQWLVVGGGTNMVFAPHYDGVIIKIAADRISFHGNMAIVEANTRWMPLLHAASKRNLGGMETFAGLPGTIGGAIRGNSGCFGMETKDFLVKATVVDEEGVAYTRDNSWFEFEYRNSKLKREIGIVWDAELKFSQMSTEQVAERMRSTAILRSKKQPAGKSTGSFFMNPPEKPAGALIDQAGLKGKRFGSVTVSEKHGNFLMNEGSGSAEDLAALVVHIQSEVENQTGILLEPEVLLVNKPWWQEQGVRFEK